MLRYAKNHEPASVMSEMTLKNVAFCLMILLFSAMSSAADTSTEQIVPPYPEIWGYDMSEFPAMKWGLAGIDAYAMDDGDIWFVVDYFYRKTNPMDFLAPTADDQYALIKFFKGEIIILNWEERKKLFEITEGKNISYYLNRGPIQFSDGSEIKAYRYRSPKGRCHEPDFSEDYFIKNDLKGNETKYSILVAYPQVEVKKEDIDCQNLGAPLFLYQKLHSLTNVIPLKDETFLVLSNNSNLILRFDKNFKTKFKPVTPVKIHGNEIMRNFFVIDYSLIENFEAQAIRKPGSFYQAVHDALLTYLQENYSDK